MIMITKDLTIAEATIAFIIMAKTSLSDTINQNDIADEFMIRRQTFIEPRKVRKIIERLIEYGYPILSTPRHPGGYCWDKRDGDALECYKRLRRKGIKILLRARRILRNHNNGQIKMFGEV